MFPGTEDNHDKPPGDYKHTTNWQSARWKLTVIHPLNKLHALYENQMFNTEFKTVPSPVRILRQTNPVHSQPV
jgi:hypothetical protein